MNREEEEDFQRLIDEANTAHENNLAYFLAGALVGMLLTIWWGVV